ncbi:hypothetical protein UlMin_027298 [Ulmus minor]
MLATMSTIIVFYFDVGENRIFSTVFLVCIFICFWRTFRTLVGLSDDVGAGFISWPRCSQLATTSELNIDRSVELPAPEDIGNMGVTKVIRADHKRFFFDLGKNNRGSDLSLTILPLSGLKQFHEMVGHFVEITKNSNRGNDGCKCSNMVFYGLVFVVLWYST